MMLEADGGHVGPNAVLSLNMEGGRGRDFLATRISDLLVHGDVRVRLAGNQGNDRIDARIALEPDSTGSASVEIHGNNGDDELSLAVFGSDGLRKLFALLDGGRGRDTCQTTQNVIVRDCEGERFPGWK